MEDGKTNAGGLTIISSNPVVANALAGRVKRVRKYPSSNPVVAKKLAATRQEKYAGLRQADGSTAFIPLARGTLDPNELTKQLMESRVEAKAYKHVIDLQHSKLEDYAKDKQIRDRSRKFPKDKTAKNILRQGSDKYDRENYDREKMIFSFTKVAQWLWDRSANWKRMQLGTKTIDNFNASEKYEYQKPTRDRLKQWADCLSEFHKQRKDKSDERASKRK